MNQIYHLMDQLHQAVTALPNYHELRLQVYQQEMMELLDRKLIRPIGRNVADALSKLAEQYGLQDDAP